MDSSDEAQLSELNSRLLALENRPAPEPVIERVSILAFPKAQLIQAPRKNLNACLRLCAQPDRLGMKV